MGQMFSEAFVGLLLTGFVIYLWSIGWAYRDAQARGKPPFFVALLVMFGGWPLGLIIWIALRPERRRPPFNLEDFRRG